MEGGVREKVSTTRHRDEDTEQVGSEKMEVWKKEGEESGDEWTEVRLNCLGKGPGHGGWKSGRGVGNVRYGATLTAGEMYTGRSVELQGIWQPAIYYRWSV